jgi:hypothetical protein
MRRRELERFLVAAQDDPVLAAWAKVVHEYRAGSHSEVSPYEHYEAFQDFYSYGLLSPVQFDGTDVKRVFFSGHRPDQGDVQSVLDNIHLLCPEHDLPEEPMTRAKAKAPTEAFSSPSALTRQVPSTLARGPSRHELGSHRAPTGLSAFQPQREVMAEPRQSAELPAFGDKPGNGGLACRDVDAKMYVGSMDLNGHIVCCGHPLQPIDDGGDIIPPEDMPHGEEFSLLEYMFHCECANCGSIYHCTVGKPVPRDTF